VTQQSNGGRNIMDRKKKVAIGLVTAGLISAGGAAALWSASGTGSGTARSVTARATTVTAATGAADLYPGFAGGDVHFTLDNPNPYPVTFTSMTPGTISSVAPSTCLPTNITVIGATGLNIPVAAGAMNVAASIPNVVTMIAAATDECQGVSFNITMTLTGAQP
jgi:hypothetical protein